MTILEFIRKNSLLVGIVIVGVGAGLVMMDYSGKTNAFSRDYYFQVNGTGYDYQEAYALGTQGKEYLSSLISATQQLADDFDTNGDGKFDEKELAAMEAWQQAHPEIRSFFEHIHTIYSVWNAGPASSSRSEENVALNRAIIQAEGAELGLRPSEEQIDEYLRQMPPFRMADGSFNTELYRRLTGYRRGTANRVQEEHFRSVIADMMVWDSIQALIAAGVHYNTKAQLAQVDTFTQNVSGHTAWLPANAVPTPADPTEEELKAFWEEHKTAYKSDERRVISVYTLKPGEDSNMENLLGTADALMQDLTQANGQGLDKILDDASQNAEFDPFTYRREDGSTHVTYPLSTQEELANLLTDKVNNDGEEMPLAQVAFSEVSDAPAVEAYKEAQAAGNADKFTSIKQIRGFYSATDGTLKLIRIEAVEAPDVLPYDDAREMALADLRAERADNALADAAKKLYEQMEAAVAEKGIPAAFELATQAGAQVENYGPASLANPFSPLPAGVADIDIIGTPSGKLTPLSIQADGARITSVDRRTVDDTPAISMQKRTMILPVENARLRLNMVLDWLNAAYKRLNVIPSEAMTRQPANNN